MQVLRIAALIYRTIDEAYLRFIVPAVGRFWSFELALKGAQLKSRVFCLSRPAVRMHHKSTLTIGKRVILMSHSRLCASGNLYGPCRFQIHYPTGKIVLGDDVAINGTSIVCRSTHITIDDGTIIAPNCIIMDSPFHRIWPPNERLNYGTHELDRPVEIGKNVWIGAGVTILAGAKIGDNSVIGAKSLVTGEIPANCLAVGNPAKVIRHLDQTS